MIPFSCSQLKFPWISDCHQHVQELMTPKGASPFTCSSQTSLRSFNLSLHWPPFNIIARLIVWDVYPKTFSSSRNLCTAEGNACPPSNLEISIWPSWWSADASQFWSMLASLCGTSPKRREQANKRNASIYFYWLESQFKS